VPSIDIDRDAAHQVAQIELDKPIYTKASAGQQFVDWINELLYRLLQKTASIPGGWFTTTVLLILLAIAVVVAIHIARRTMRTNRGGDYMLFEAAQLTAAQHRATAESYAAEGNWTAAIRHRLRAVARQLEETGTLNPAPGRTANELASDAGTALPHLAGELSQAATAFNDVTYGERPGTQASYQMIADLDDHLRSRAPAAAAVAGQLPAAESWAQVR
jgi:type IV secretory pathway TrbL component